LELQTQQELLVPLILEALLDSLLNNLLLDNLQLLQVGIVINNCRKMFFNYLQLNVGFGATTSAFGQPKPTGFGFGNTSTPAFGSSKET
jgi:hypothetical protein